MELPIQSKIIEQVAGLILKPKGLERIGRSRRWRDDHGWFTTIVEFQPLSGRQATGINVGVGFHWYPKDYFSYDIGYRGSGFVIFESEEQFTSAVEKLTQIGLEKVIGYRKALQNLESARQLILNKTFNSEEMWGNYHKGTISALTHDATGARRYYNRLLSKEHSTPFEKAIAAKTRELIEKSKDSGLFRLAILNIIAETRSLKKLKKVDISDLLLI